MDTNYKPQESVADFRARIAAVMRERETGKRFSVVGGPRAHPSVVRQPSDRGYGIAGPGREYEANPDPRYNATVFAQVRSDIESCTS